MAHTQDDSPFTGFGVVNLSKLQEEEGVFILAVYRDDVLTAAAHATERGAMAAAVELIESEMDDEDERSTLEDRFARAQRMVSEEGGLLEIIPSPIHGD